MTKKINEGRPWDVEEALTYKGIAPLLQRGVAEEEVQRPHLTSEQEGRLWDVEEALTYKGIAPLLQRGVAEEEVQRPHLTSEQGRVEPWINWVRRYVKESHPMFYPTNQPTIFMPPPNISQIDRAAYGPSLVSIGPLYGGFDELQNCKWRFLRCLLSRCRNGNEASRILDECLMDLKARDKEVRGCYSINLIHTDPCKLAAMMLLDGCFIIYLMLRRQDWGETSPHRMEALEGRAELGTPIITRQSIIESSPHPLETLGACLDTFFTCSLLKKQQGIEESTEQGTPTIIGESIVETSPCRLDTLEESAEQGTPTITGESIVEKVDKVQESRMKEEEELRNLTAGAEMEEGLGSGLESAVDLQIGGAESFDGSLFGNLWTWNLIVYDLLKLGNQIPFFVIRLIFDKLFKMTSDDPGNADQLTNLALNLFSDIHPNKSIRFRTTPPNTIHHLLHLFHSSIVLTDRQVSQPSALAPMREARTTPEWIPNATDLAMAGVKFKQKKKFDSFLDVSFKNGILEVPPLRIYDYTKSLFRNLIAFEQCYHVTNNDITIYAYFMDCIVDTSNDARLLYRKRILINRLSTDDEMASLFNQLCNQIHIDPTKNYLNDLFIEVTKYHESKWHQWRSGLVRDYFSNPWAIISLFAAVLLLLLTMEQCFFAAFSYFQPPKS